MFRVTLRELLLLTAFFGVALAGLKYAGEWTLTVISNAALLCLMIAAVVASADRGRRRAIASGFASCLAIYLALLFFHPNNSRYIRATDMLLDRLYEVVVTRTWYDDRTREELAYDSRWPEIGYPDHVKANPSPKRNYFMAVGHSLWALVFGYLGSRFAAWIYDRRHNNRGTPPPNSDRPGPSLVPADR